MSVRNKNNCWYYEFMVKGKRYFGSCLDADGHPVQTEEQARHSEDRIRTELGNIRANKSIKAMAENYRLELTGGKMIPLHEAFERSLSKPRKRMPGERRLALKRGHWADFCAYMEDLCAEATHLAEITRVQAENYAGSLLTYGKYERRKPGCRRERKPLSPATVTDYLTTITEVFDLLADDAGLISNPFEQIPKPSLDTETRQPFSPEELALIRKNLDPFVEPLFVLAMSTALREGDICTLRWDEIDFDKQVIRRRKMRKTQVGVDIPIMPELETYLRRLFEQRSAEGAYTEYVLPIHAKMYLSNRCGVSYRVKKFLEEACGIVTTVKLPGRSRSISVKDLHSCRHTFCYFAGLNGIPMNIVQGIVGHMTPEMTKLYSNHATLEAKREKMRLLPEFLSLAPNTAEQRDCSSDLEVQALLRRIPGKYASELVPLLSGIADGGIKTLISLRRSLE